MAGFRVGSGVGVARHGVELVAGCRRAGGRIGRRHVVGRIARPKAAHRRRSGTPVSYLPAEPTPSLAFRLAIDRNVARKVEL